MPSIAEILSSRIGKNGKSKTYIASELKVSEKTIENYMNGKRQPKPAALVRLSELLEFNLNELSEQIVPRETHVDVEQKVENVKLYGAGASYLPEYIAALKEHNAFLQELVKLNLASLSDTQRVILAQVKAGNQYEAIKAGQGNKKKEEAVLKVLNTLAGANLTGVSSVDSKVTEGM